MHTLRRVSYFIVLTHGWKSIAKRQNVNKFHEPIPTEPSAASYFIDGILCIAGGKFGKMIWSNVGNRMAVRSAEEVLKDSALASEEVRATEKAAFAVVAKAASKELVVAERSLEALKLEASIDRGIVKEIETITKKVDQAIASKPPIPPRTKPPFPEPNAGTDPRWTYQGHQTAAIVERELAVTVHSMPNEIVVSWGDKIGAHGADVVSVNVHTGEVTLWDAKFRTRVVTLPQSATFTPGSTRLQNAIDKAIEELAENTTLTAEIRKKALDNLGKKAVNTRTIGYGNATIKP